AVGTSPPLLPRWRRHRRTLCPRHPVSPVPARCGRTQEPLEICYCRRDDVNTRAHPAIPSRKVASADSVSRGAVVISHFFILVFILVACGLVGIAGILDARPSSAPSVLPSLAGVLFCLPAVG